MKHTKAAYLHWLKQTSDNNANRVGTFLCIYCFPAKMLNTFNIIPLIIYFTLLTCSFSSIVLILRILFHTHGISRYCQCCAHACLVSTKGSGGFRGAVAPPPAISGHTKGWMCCYKNTLILANSDVLYISMHNNLYLPKDCTHHTPWYYFG